MWGTGLTSVTEVTSRPAAWSDRMAFRDPALALHERWGGRLYWHDGSHVGHLMSPRVQVVTEEFLTGLQ